MATTIHLPQALLAKVDAAARKKAMSRSKYIAVVLERAVADPGWSPQFQIALEGFDPADPASRAADEMLKGLGIARGRSGGGKR